MNNQLKSESTEAYVGNTRTVAESVLQEYCSRFGLVVSCSRRLRSPERAHLVDFTFVRFLNDQSCAKFLSTSPHVLSNGVALDVRPFQEILHPAVPLHVDRKICIANLSSQVPLSELKKYLRTFGAIKQVSSETNADEQRRVYVEFESAAARNKLLKGKVQHHRVRDQLLSISALLRPTDVDLQPADESNDEMNGPSAVIHLEREYNLCIRQQFDAIESRISELINQKRQSYAHLRRMLQ